MRIKNGILIIFCILLSGCAENLTGYQYSASDTNSIQEVHYGKITSIENVKINGSKSGVGGMGGAVAGGLIGSTIGRGKGSTLAAVGGAIAGALAGNEIEKNTTEKNGINMFIKLCSGKTISIVQQIDPKNPLRAGDRVKVLIGVKHSRVTYDPHANCGDDENSLYPN